MFRITAQAILNSIAGAAANLFGGCASGLFAFCQDHGFNPLTAPSLQAGTQRFDLVNRDFGFKSFGASSAYLMAHCFADRGWGFCACGTPQVEWQLEWFGMGLVGSSSDDSSDFYRYLLAQGETLLRQLGLRLGDRPTDAPMEGPMDEIELDLLVPAMGAATPTGGVIGKSIHGLIHKLGVSVNDSGHFIRSGKYRLAPVLLET